MTEVSPSSQPMLTLQGVHKRFGPVHALKGVDLQIHAGEVHALIGENGAGKSTLMKVLSGAHACDEGEIRLKGSLYSPRDPQEARGEGIAMIYQELTLAPHLSIEENIDLGMERGLASKVKSRRQEVQDALAQLGQGHLDPSVKVGRLPIGTRQLIEIARAMVNRAEVVILDEPTSSLSSEDTRKLFEVINMLRDQGIAIIYISHFLEEIQSISDRYTILRDGSTCGTGSMENVSIPEIVEMMVGRSLEEMYPKIPHEIGAKVMSVKSLKGDVLPKEASFDLHQGEVLGIFGLVGAGRSEMLRCIYGLEQAESGRLEIEGRSLDLTQMSPKLALKNGIDFLSEDRKTEGLAQKMSIANNTTLSSLSKVSKQGVINLVEEARTADHWVSFMKTKCHRSAAPISSLSGGNQQKVAIARMLNHGCSVLMLDEPTRGIDVGSKSEIYEHIQRLAKEGKSVIVVSSYLPELHGVCDTMAVMYRGQLSSVKSVEQWNEKDVMVYATTGVEPSLAQLGA